uniref:histidine kinase n=1 Tax=Magnetococcus massalia (strain MO-1) TaxID=451514 RepID=A0A1S7LK84_MAGMO|nr:Putative sensor histidine kinase with a response regulator receiver domain [Candidatus Magnetococcus massalia]
MNLRSQFSLALLPLILLAVIGLGQLNSMTTAEDVEQYHSTYLNTILTSFIEGSLKRRHQILDENGLMHLASFVEQYQQEIFRDADLLAAQHQVHFVIFSFDGLVQHATKMPDALLKNAPIVLDHFKHSSPGDELHHISTMLAAESGIFYHKTHFTPWKWQVVVYDADQRFKHAVNQIGTSTLIVAMLLTLTVGGLIYLLLQRLVLTPLGLLQSASDQIAQQQSVAEIPLHGTNEMTALARTIETMSGAITEHQNHLQAQSNLLRSVMAANPDLICLKNSSLVYLAVNPAFCAFMQREESEILGRTDWELMPKDEAKAIVRKDEQVLAAGHTTSLEHSSIGPGGRAVHQHIVHSPVKDSQGQIVGLLTAIRDITTRKEAEEELKLAHEKLEQKVDERTRALQESEARLRIITESLPAAIWMSSPSFEKVHYVSPGYEQIWGQSRHQLYLSPHELLHAIHPSDRAFVLERMRQNLHQPWEAEFRILRPEGSIRWIRCQSVPFQDEVDGVQQVRFLIGCAFDVTDLKETEKALSKAKQDAESANQAKSAFLATMSHEIRTPLNGITGMLEQLRRSGLDQNQDHQAGVIAKCTDVLMDILNDVLDFSKIEAGQLLLEKSPFSPVMVIDDLVEVMRPQAASKGLQLELEVEKGFPQATMGDATRLRQIALNLIGNAIKFTRTGHITITLAVKEQYGEQLTITLEVLDSGIGISQEKLAQLFDPFTQADTSITREYGGTGLGLAICKRLAEAMDGTIEVESYLGKGTRFLVTLPLTLSDAPIVYEPLSDEPPVIAASEILLVEDEIVNQQVAHALLVDEGHQVDVAENGLEAVSQCQQKRYDVILMDLRMPEMDGIQASQTIRLEGPNRETPIIAITADVLKSTVERCYEVGINKVLTKPLHPSSLNHALQEMGLPQLTPEEVSAQEQAKSAPPEPVPAATAPMEPGQGLNTERFNYLVGSLDEKQLTRILGAFYSTATSCQSGLQQALEHGDEGSLSHTAHKLAGSAASLGLVDLQKTAKALENCQDNGECALLMERIEQLIQQGFATITQITGVSFDDH